MALHGSLVHHGSLEKLGLAPRLGIRGGGSGCSRPHPGTLAHSSRCSFCIHGWAIQETQGGCGVGLSLYQGKVKRGEGPTQCLASSPSTELPIARAAGGHRLGQLACAQPGSGNAVNLAQRCPEVRARRRDEEGSMQLGFLCLQWLLTSLPLLGGHHLSQRAEGAAHGAPVT